MKPNNFNDYYKYYLTLHQKRETKIFHIIGNFLTIVYLFLSIYIAIFNIIFVPLIFITPFIVYPFAWYSHLVFEKNKPAAWSNPIWAKMCDWRMIYEVLTGKIKLQE
jgi:hypothetical protein